TLINASTLLNTNQFPAMAYDQFQLPIATSTVVPLYLGIVIYINSPLNNVLGNLDSVIFDRVSLVPNDFAIDASVETFDSSLRKCQAYYEKSYDVSVFPGATTYIGASTVYDQGLLSVYGLDRPFKVEKIRTPLVVWYAAKTGTINAVTARITNPPNNDVVANSDPSYLSTQSTGIPIVSVSGSPITDVITGAQWTANSLLGIF
ncbi:MAG TPA: hypothetical protein VNX68_02025, partial [Nitrosopumilaceae archaeon]|nr:hypothetical protein [Nitrosopumilaceae archaeon]